MKVKLGGASGLDRPRLRRKHLRRACAYSVLLWIMAGQPASAQNDQPRTLMGTVGLIDMPSARMAPDGELAVGASFFQNTQHYNFSFQVTPWLETDFRYSGLQHFDPSFPVYYDRSFAFKVRLWDETAVFPAVAIGVNDLVGTGIYSGEYLVATKQFGSVDATLGIGWGRLATANTFRNPLSLISSSFDKRAGLNPEAGQFAFSSYFHGRNVGVFGGAVWHTPIPDLSLIAEYSSDAYALEQSRGTFSPRNRWNLGASYHLFDNMTLGLDWLYGRSISGSVSIQLNPADDPYPQRIETEKTPVHLRTDEEQQLGITALMNGHNAASRNAVPVNSLVDALWNAPGIRDVEVQGTTLAVFMDAPTSSSCAAIATLVARYKIAIDTVSIVQNGKPPTRCAVDTIRMADYSAAAIMPATLITLRDPPPEPLVIDARLPAARNIQAAITAIRSDAAKQQIIINAVSLSQGEALVYYSNVHYLHENEVVDRLVRILMAEAPPDIEKFRLIATAGGKAQTEFDILRASTEREISQTGQYDILGGSNTFHPAPLDNPVLAAVDRGTYPRFSWALFPQFRQELFDPDNPFAVQLLAGLSGTAEILPGLSLQGEVEASIYDNFNIGRPSDSDLPHVRTDFLTYFTKGKNGIGNLEADYRFRLAPNVFAIARVGYLESMFAGVGGEVLWRPEGQRWALGVDLYDVKQRAFDRLFGFRDYSVLTGHVSLYYSSPWYQLNFVLRAGQYLARDRGITFEVSRRFSTGVEIGVFATKTNVSSARFGEGSFDKGITIRIPIEWTLPVHTQSTFAMDLRPVQRDGGQRLYGDAILYEETRRTSQSELLLHGDD